MSKLTIKNNINSELSITHADNKPAKSIIGTDIAVAVGTINDFPLDASDGDTVIVRDLNRGGTFIYDSSKVVEHNDGTNFNGWIRQYSGAVNVKWFGDTSTQQNAVATINKAFLSGDYEYIIPSDADYGFSEHTNVMLPDILTLPNRDFIIYDASISSDYTDTPEQHQGAQTRTFYNFKDATIGQHDGFNYLYANHHIGDFYTLTGDGIEEGTSNFSRNVTTFYGINGSSYWGVGMGGTTITVADPNNVTQAELLSATNFKIVANHLRGVNSLTNVMNISNTTANVGFFAGNEPPFKYSFYSPNGDDARFVMKNQDIDNSYMKEYSINNEGKAWNTQRTNEITTIQSPLGTALQIYHRASDESGLVFTGRPNQRVFCELLSPDGGLLKISVEGTTGKIYLYTQDGGRYTLTKEGNLSADNGVSGNTTTTANRPSAYLCANGTMMFDTDLGKPIWLPDNTSNTWVDATGTVV